MANIDIIGLGAMNIDHLYQVDKIVTDGEQLATDYKSLPGGSAANTIYGLGKLGIKTGFISAIGTDANGKKLIEDFGAANVDTSQIKFKDGSSTGSVLCLSDKSNKRALYVSPGANNLLTPDDISLTYSNQARIVHFSSFAHDKQFDIQVDLAKQLGPSIKVSLAPGMIYASKGLTALKPLLHRTDIIFMNREEIEQLTARDFAAGARECLAQGCHIVVVTLGRGLITEKGNTIIGYIRDIENEYHIESLAGDEIPEPETTGAGDAFAAGFLFGFLRGKPIDKCGLLGDIMACFAISAVGAREGLPSLAQLSERYFQRSGEPL